MDPNLIAHFERARLAYETAVERLVPLAARMAAATVADVLPDAHTIEVRGEMNEDWLPTLRIQRVRNAAQQVLFDAGEGHDDPAVEQAIDDESRRRATYLLVCVVVDDSDIAATRRWMRQLLLPGQRRLHFVNESDRQRRRLLAEFTRLPIRAAAARVQMGSGGEAEARRRALGYLASGQRPRLRRLVIESRAGRDQEDRRTLHGALRDQQLDSLVTYEHRRPSEEPLLWLPDGIAWAIGAGGNWARQLDALDLIVTEIAC